MTDFTNMHPAAFIKHHAPKFICAQAGVSFYENPEQGDEAPLLALRGDVIVESELFDYPEHHEAEELCARLDLIAFGIAAAEETADADAAADADAYFDRETD